MTAKVAKDTANFEALVQQDFQQNRIPFLANVSSWPMHVCTAQGIVVASICAAWSALPKLMQHEAAMTCLVACKMCAITSSI